MLHIRVINTRGKSRAVQVIRYQDSKRIIVKHIGSGSTDQEIDVLSPPGASLHLAQVW